MSELAKAYEPQAVEEKWYAWWLEQGCFHADPSSPKPAYSIVIPPPNVTGVLTLGHVLNNTIQDILARRAPDRARGVVAAGHGSRRHRDADRGGAQAAQGGEENAARSWPGGVFAAGVGVEGKTRRHHYQSAQKAWVFLRLRLGAGAFHDGRGLRAQGAGGVCESLQKGAHLSRQAHGELVPGFADGALGRGGDSEGAKGGSLPFQGRGD